MLVLLGIEAFRHAVLGRVFVQAAVVISSECSSFAPLGTEAWLACLDRPSGNCIICAAVKRLACLVLPDIVAHCTLSLASSCSA